MAAGKTIFLSHFINDQTPLYGGGKGLIKFEKISSISQGNTANSIYFRMPNHSGTHIDFPLHFSNDAKSINDYPPEFWIFRNVGFINSSICSVENLFSELNKNIEFLIIKTGFGKYRGEKKYWSEQPIIPSALATSIKRNFPKIRAIGFDMISLTSKLDREEGRKAHEEFLLKENILVVEDMDLCKINMPPLDLYVFPLLLEKADGSPCTVIANF
jgi:arylformamidase